MPKLIYTLRVRRATKHRPTMNTTPHPQYTPGDSQHRSIGSRMESSDAASGEWRTRVRLATDLALPAFLASSTVLANLTLQLVAESYHAVVRPTSTDQWSPPRLYLMAVACKHSRSRLSSGRLQKAWDMPLFSRRATGDASCRYPSRARPTYCGCCSSLRRLPACPACSSVGTRLDDTSLRIGRRSPSRLPRLCTTHLAAESQGQFLIARLAAAICWSKHTTTPSTT